MGHISRCERDCHIQVLDCFQRRAAMLGNALEQQSDEQQLRELGGGLSLEKRRLGGTVSALKG